MRKAHGVRLRSGFATVGLVSLVVAGALQAGACSSSSGSNGAAPTQAQAAADIDVVLASSEALVFRAIAQPTASDVVGTRTPDLETDSYPCSAGGTETVTSNTAAGPTTSQADVTITWSKCNDGAKTLDGTFAFTTATSGSTTTITMQGGPIAYTVGSTTHTLQFPQVFTITATTSGGQTVETLNGTVVVDGASITYEGDVIVDDAGAPATTDDSGSNSCGGSTPTGCSVSVCADPSTCAGSGVSASTYPCRGVGAQYDGASGQTSIPIIGCGSDTGLQWAVVLTGSPVAGTYQSTNPILEGSGLICAGSLTGAYWGAAPSGAADGGALGSFTVTLTSVTPDTNVGSGGDTTVYYVHGTVSATCVGGPSEDGGPGPAGTVTAVATF